MLTKLTKCFWKINRNEPKLTKLTTSYLVEFYQSIKIKIVLIVILWLFFIRPINSSIFQSVQGVGVKIWNDEM